MDTEQEERIVRAVAELAEDVEFARRWHVSARGEKIEQVARYFTERGVAERFATYLAMTYVASAMHTLGEFDRAMTRVTAAMFS